MSNRAAMYGRPAAFATSVGMVEPIPAGAIVDGEKAFYGGTLFFHLEEGRAGCSNPECGWSGVPSVVDGVIATWCPKCQRGRSPRVPGDAPLARGGSFKPTGRTLFGVGEPVTAQRRAAGGKRKAERNAKRHARRKARKKGKR